MGLREYWRKRDFSITPEPSGKNRTRREPGLSFVIQKHAASHLHYDFRLELDGVLKSWSVPKGPSLDPDIKRLAMETEDHPLDYGDFEGIIPKGQYGGGTVLLWDQGTWEPLENPRRGYHAGKLKFLLKGKKLKGGWMLVRIHGRDDRDEGRTWLLRKEEDAEARPEKEIQIAEARQESVATGRSMDEIAAAKDRVWTSNRAEKASDEKPAQATKRAASGTKRAAAHGASRGRIAARAAARIEGARKRSLPEAVRPQKPAPVSAPPSGGEWLHEIQHDGCRVIARIEEGRARLLGPQGEDVTERFPAIVAAAEDLGLDQAVLDGEAALLRPDGTTVPPPLRKRAAAASDHDGGELVYFVFDLIHLAGYDLTGAPLSARKAALEAVLGASGASASDSKGPLRYSGHIEGSGEDVFKKGCELSLKGIVSKRRDAPYEPGRSSAWVRAVCQGARKAAAKKATAKKATAKEGTAKKAAAKSAVKKAAVKKAAAKSAVKKTAVKKAASRKSPPQKAASARRATPSRP